MEHSGPGGQQSPSDSGHIRSWSPNPGEKGRSGVLTEGTGYLFAVLVVADITQPLFHRSNILLNGV